MLTLAESLATPTLWLAAGLGVFLFVLNRWLIAWSNERAKPFVVLAALLCFTGLPALWGLALGRSWWLAVPLGVLGLLGTGELRQRSLRNHYRRDSPVATVDSAGSSRAPVTTTTLARISFGVEIPGWSGPEVVVAHVSDLHVNDRLPADYYAAAMDQIGAAGADIVVVTGDFVSKLEFLPLLAPLLRRLRGRLGVFGVLGNHDHWAGAAAVTETVRECGVRLVGSAHETVELATTASILLSGCEDPWGPARWSPPAVRTGQLSLALMHTPDNVYRAARAGFTAAFAGHNHAGQIRIPGLGAVVVPSLYGRRFDHGHFRVSGTHLFVTAGVGAALPSFRLFCRPDFLLVRFRGTCGAVLDP